ncbi:hypothetical protein J6590_076320 [Homalodisca vitripennis]|nr:hypothetical protein J6590_076320 [Homalodisca vitripennis]
MDGPSSSQIRHYLSESDVESSSDDSVASAGPESDIDQAQLDAPPIVNVVAPVDIEDEDTDDQEADQVISDPIWSLRTADCPSSTCFCLQQTQSHLHSGLQQTTVRHVLSKMDTPDNTGERMKRKRCRECSKTKKRTMTLFFCAQCPGEPGLCALRCFDKYHE